MQKQRLKLLANIIGVYMMANVLLLIEARGIIHIILFSFMLWLLNLFLRPLFLLITLPINMLTLGIFTLLVNTWMIMITNILVRGVKIPGFLSSFSLAILIMLINSVLNKLFKEPN